MPEESEDAAPRRERDDAERGARDAVLAVGQLRGHVAELETQLERARQDHEPLRAMIERTAAERLVDRAVEVWASRRR